MKNDPDKELSMMIEKIEEGHQARDGDDRWRKRMRKKSRRMNKRNVAKCNAGASREEEV